MAPLARFQKRFYTLPLFLRHAGGLLAHAGDLLRARRGGRVDRRFAERLMLAVTQVNECRYCRAYHSRMAREAGLGEAELSGLLAGDFAGAPPEQRLALVFAQGYAESHEQVDPAEWARLEAAYGPQAARDILAYLRVITMGNLLGNTWEAVLWRLRGGG